MTVSRRGFLVATGLGAAGLAVRPAHATPFPDKLWERRLLLLFASERGDRFDRQMALVATPQFRQRDFDLIEVVGNEPIRIDGVAHDTPTAAELRRLYRVVGDFAVRVVGKDGGVKLESRRFVTMEQLAELVDAMPMRRQEMQERGES